MLSMWSGKRSTFSGPKAPFSLSEGGEHLRCAAGQATAPGATPRQKRDDSGSILVVVPSTRPKMNRDEMNPDVGDGPAFAR